MGPIQVRYTGYIQIAVVCYNDNNDLVPCRSLSRWRTVKTQWW